MYKKNMIVYIGAFCSLTIAMFCFINFDRGPALFDIRKSVNMESAISEYKNVLHKIEALQLQKELIRNEIFRLCNNRKFKGLGIRIDKVQPVATIDWKKAKDALNISDSMIEPFKKEREPYFRLKVEREIIL